MPSRDDLAASTHVYLVTHSDWDSYLVLSAWTTEEPATAEVERLNKKGYSGRYTVEEVALNESHDD